MFPEDFKSGQYRDRTTGQVQTEWPLSWWGIVQPSKELLDEHRRGYPKLRRLLAEREEAAKKIKVEVQAPVAAGGGGGVEAPPPAAASAAGRYDYVPPHHQRGPPGPAGQSHFNPPQRQAHGYPDQRQQHQQRRPDQPPYHGGRYPPGTGPPGPNMGVRGPPMNMMGRGGGPGPGPGRGGMGGPPHGPGGRGGPPMMHSGGRGGPGGRDEGRGRGGGYGGGYR